MKIYYVHCPNCDCKLQIEEYPKVSFVIDLDGNPIDNCPECLIPLIIIDGELKHDKLQNS